jgi:hypothetical protein
MSPPIKLILDFHESRSFGTHQNRVDQERRVRAAYRSLSSREQTELTSAAIGQCERNNRYASRILGSLACFQPGSLAAFHDRLVDAELFCPGVIYSGAGSDTSLRLLRILEAEEPDSHTLRCNHLLLALAWIGDANVQAAFAHWRQQRPSWALSLHVEPCEYAKEAGWELTGGGERRNLFSEVCHPLVPANTGIATLRDVAVVVQTEQLCPWCGRSLTELLRFDSLGRVVPEYEVAEFHALTCDVCTAYGQIFSKGAISRETAWHDKNVRPEYLPENTRDWPLLPESPLAMSPDTRYFLEATWWSAPAVAASQVGGFPTWIQDAEYPLCPDCTRTMSFVGQISNEDFLEHAEGIYYVFVCLDCGVSATNYQQS